MFRNIVVTALLAGSIAGLCLWLIQQWQVIPLILEAETYEQQGESQIAAHGPQQGHGDEAVTEGGEWTPGKGWQRALYTVFANVLTGIGFGLILGAAMGWRGLKRGWHGLLWGAGGFLTFYLAPTLGLPAELPGTEAAPLLQRQAWWLLTVLATGSGIGLLCLQRKLLWLGIGVMLLIAPHLLGAPQPDGHQTWVPVEMTQRFGSVTLIANLLFWLTLGLLTGSIHKRLGLHPTAG